MRIGLAYIVYVSRCTACCVKTFQHHAAPVISLFFISWNYMRQSIKYTGKLRWSRNVGQNAKIWKCTATHHQTKQSAQLKQKLEFPWNGTKALLEWAKPLLFDINLCRQLHAYEPLPVLILHTDTLNVSFNDLTSLIFLKLFYINLEQRVLVIYRKLCSPSLTQHPTKK